MHRKLVPIILMIVLIGVGIVSAHEGQAHLRVGHFAAGAPNVDVFINGEAALTDFAPASLSDFIEVAPGTLNVAVAAAGEGVDKALFAPASLEAEADHNYTVAVIGQVDDNSLMPALVDETAEMADCDMSKSVMRILFNNIAGAPPISFYENNMWVEKNIAYGTYTATCIPAFTWDTGKAVLGENLDDILFDFDSTENDGVSGFWEPYTVYLWGLMGKYPGAPGEDYDFGGGNSYTVAPDAVSFLAAFSGLKLTGDSEIFFEFDRAVAAFKAAGLDEMLRSGGPYTLFVPIDQGFDALPEGTLDSWMADPAALSSVLQYHVVQGAMTYDDLIAAGTVKTLQGADLSVTGPTDEADEIHFYLNGDTRVMNFVYPLPDGSLVWFIDNFSVLMPPA